MSLDHQEEKLVEHLFRTEYGKLISILTKYFGSSQLQLVEDIVQDSLISAITHWGKNGIPHNPTAWLVQVARRKALNEIKRSNMMQKHHASGFFKQFSEAEIDQVYLADEIADSQLRMIFTCCHPQLSLESRIALTLKSLCGFSTKQIARALLNTESTINKRVYRAKEKIKQADSPFQVPQGKELLDRLEAVSLTLYLMFNQGYHAASGSSMIQKDLCLEAIRLTKLLVTTFSDHYQLKALLALMCFHTARFEARIDHRGALILFEDQDRSKWNQELIHIGMQYFHQAIQGKTLSTYHIEARIAAEHCLAHSFEDTNWPLIFDQYTLLYRLSPTPIIQLNLAIIQSKIRGIEHSLHLLKELEEDQALRDYYLLPATLGIFYMKIGRYDDALPYLEKTLSLHPSAAERSFIQEKILVCKQMRSRS